MTSSLTLAALLCAVAGVLCASLALLRTGDTGLALGVLLDLLLAAGLLRLTVTEDAAGLVVAAALVAVRALAARGVRRTRTARTADAS